MPALMEAYKLSSRASHVGFDWPEMEGLFAKLEEETLELREELKSVPALCLQRSIGREGNCRVGKAEGPAGTARASGR